MVYIRWPNTLDTSFGCLFNQGFEAFSIINDFEHSLLMLISEFICRLIQQLNNGWMLQHFDGDPYLGHHVWLFAHKHWNVPFPSLFHFVPCFALILFTLTTCIYTRFSSLWCWDMCCWTWTNQQSLLACILTSAMACIWHLPSHNLMFITMYKKVIRMSVFFLG